MEYHGSHVVHLRDGPGPSEFCTHAMGEEAALMFLEDGLGTKMSHRMAG
jgi:hypothetical protein